MKRLLKRQKSFAKVAPDSAAKRQLLAEGRRAYRDMIQARIAIVREWKRQNFAVAFPLTIDLDALVPDPHGFFRDKRSDRYLCEIMMTQRERDILQLKEKAAHDAQKHD